MRWTRGFVVVALLLLAGCAKPPANQGVTNDPPASQSPTPGETAGLAGTSSGPLVVPAAAMLQPADLKGARTDKAESDLAPHLRPPRPCGTVGPSEAQRDSAAAIKALYPQAGGAGSEMPTVLIELVMRFRGDGAAKYLAELRADLDKCRAADKNGRTWVLTGEGLVGESVQLSVTERVEVGDGQRVPQTLPVIVGRVGDTVFMLTDLGWESGHGHEDLVRALGPKAAERIRNAIK